MFSRVVLATSVTTVAALGKVAKDVSAEYCQYAPKEDAVLTQCFNYGWVNGASNCPKDTTPHSDADLAAARTAGENSVTCPTCPADTTPWSDADLAEARTAGENSVTCPACPTDTTPHSDADLEAARSAGYTNGHNVGRNSVSCQYDWDDVLDERQATKDSICDTVQGSQDGGIYFEHRTEKWLLYHTMVCNACHGANNYRLSYNCNGLDN